MDNREDFKILQDPYPCRVHICSGRFPSPPYRKQSRYCSIFFRMSKSLVLLWFPNGKYNGNGNTDVLINNRIFTLRRLYKATIKCIPFSILVRRSCLITTLYIHHFTAHIDTQKLKCFELFGLFAVNLLAITTYELHVKKKDEHFKSKKKSINVCVGFYIQHE